MLSLLRASPWSAGSWLATNSSRFRKPVHTLSLTQLENLDGWINRISGLSDEAAQKPPRWRKCELEVSRLVSIYNKFPTRIGGSSMSLDDPLPTGFNFAIPPPYERVQTQRTDIVNEDGTSAEEFYGIPAPFTRRMWASGRMTLQPGRNLIASPSISTSNKVLLVAKKGKTEEDPKVFFTRRFLYGLDAFAQDEKVHGESDAYIVEDRTHVFLTLSHQRIIREVEDLPQPHFSFTYTPTETHLQEFSTISQNPHKIHLDRDYCREKEGLRDLVVHGPFTAFLLLELMTINLPAKSCIHTFSYRATNTFFVDEPCTLNGAFLDESQMTAKLWAVSDKSVVGMIADVSLSPLP